MAHLSTFSDQSADSLTCTVSCTIPATATYCVLFACMRGSSGGSVLTSATLDTQAFTLDNSTLREFTTFQAVEAGYILAADMPSGTVTATATRNTATDGFAAFVMFFDDVDQAVPKVTLNGNGSGGDPFNTSVTLSGAGVLAEATMTSSPSASFTVNQTGQTLQASESITGESVAAFASTRAVSSGSQTTGYDTAGNTNRTTTVLLGLESAGGATVTQADDTPEDGVQQSFTTTGLTGTITAATLAGYDILSLLSDTDPTTPTTYTLDISATTTSTGLPRIGKTSTLSVTATGGSPTDDVVIQPKTGWAVVDLEDVINKDANGFVATVEADFGITVVATDISYYDAADNADITVNGVYTSDLTEEGEFTEFVIQQGGSATTTSTSEGGAFYPFGEGGGGGGISSTAIQSVQISTNTIQSTSI